jgi:hypothetical protein
VAPYEVNFGDTKGWDTKDGIRVLGLSFGANKAVFGCLINGDGERSNQIPLKHILAKRKNAEKVKDLEEIKNFISKSYRTSSSPLSPQSSSRSTRSQTPQASVVAAKDYILVAPSLRSMPIEATPINQAKRNDRSRSPLRRPSSRPPVVAPAFDLPPVVAPAPANFFPLIPLEVFQCPYSREQCRRGILCPYDHGEQPDAELLSLLSYISG